MQKGSCFDVYLTLKKIVLAKKILLHSSSKKTVTCGYKFYVLVLIKHYGILKFNFFKCISRTQIHL